MTVSQKMLEETESISLLEQTAMELLDFDDEQDDLYEYIGKRIQQFSGADVVVVNSSERGRFSINKSIAGLSAKYQRVMDILGFDPSSITIEIQNDTFDFLKSGNISRSLSLYSLTLGQIPRRICTTLEKLLGITDIYQIGFARRGQVFGGVAMFFSDGRKIRNTKLIRTFVKQSSIALQHKITRDNLKRSEMQFRNIFENALTGIYRTDRSGNIILANSAFYKFFGYNSLEEIKQVNANQTYLYPEKRQQFIEEMEKKGYVSNFENSGIKKNGEFIHFIESAIRVCDQHGNFLYYEGNIIDITEKKKMENDLIRAKEKAEESDRLKSAFLANMSHEIRTPMNGIMGFANLLKEPNLSGSEQQEYIRMIEQSSQRMLSIINDLIDLSKIEAGQVKIDGSKFNLNRQTEYLYNLFKQEATAKGLSFSYHNDLPDQKASICSDKEKFYAILANLIKNAIKFTEQGGIAFGYHAKDGMIEFFVRDTGIGISKEHQKTVFERFVQADLEKKEAKQGAGLGLAITHAYVEMLGGDIRLESQKGKGSTFTFTLPLNPGNT
jgi:PAS domain S-box-containing protein